MSTATATTTPPPAEVRPAARLRPWLGTAARLVMEFALETTSRRMEVARLAPQHVKAGRIKLRELITNTFELGEINTAISQMRDGGVRGRCLVRMSQSE